MTTLKRVSPVVFAMVVVAVLMLIAIVATAQTPNHNTLLASLHTIKPAKSIEVLLQAGYIDGQVFHDANHDCAATENEAGMKAWYVRAEGEKTFYAQTDCHGNFSLMVDPGEYKVTLMPSGTTYAACQCSPETQLVQVRPGTAATEVYFPVVNGLTN